MAAKKLDDVVFPNVQPPPMATQLQNLGGASAIVVGALGGCIHSMAQCQINHRKSTRPWRFHKTTGGGPGALFFSSPMPEPEESPPRTPIGGHLPNCGLLERNAAGGMAPQPVGERSENLATVGTGAGLIFGLGVGFGDGHFLWTPSSDTSFGYLLWTLSLDTFFGHYLWIWLTTC
jgi:hypothetical protein